jgi:hypothetical protein
MGGNGGGQSPGTGAAEEDTKWHLSRFQIFALFANLGSLLRFNPPSLIKSSIPIPLLNESAELLRCFPSSRIQNLSALLANEAVVTSGFFDLPSLIRSPLITP